MGGTQSLHTNGDRFTLKSMNSALKMMDLSLKMMDFASTTTI